MKRGSHEWSTSEQLGKLRKTYWSGKHFLQILLRKHQLTGGRALPHPYSVVNTQGIVSSVGGPT